MRNKRRTQRPDNSSNTNPESVPNSVARSQARLMGSSFSSSSRRNSRAAESEGAAASAYSSRYARRSLNLRENGTGPLSRLQRAARRHSTATASGSGLVRDSSDQTPGPRRSARISSRLLEQRSLSSISPTLSTDATQGSGSGSVTSSTGTPFTLSLTTRPGSAGATPPIPSSQPPPLPSSQPPSQPPSRLSSRPDSSFYNTDSMEVSDGVYLMGEGWQWREFSQDSPVRDAAPSTPTRTPLPPISRTSSPAPDAPDNDTQSVEIVRVVPHRLIEIPASGEPFEPRPPPRLRPSSGRTSIGSGVFRRARRLLRESTSSSQQTVSPTDQEPENNANTPRSRQFREIRFSHTAQDGERAGSSAMSDEALRGRVLERAEHEALNNMIQSSSVTANERLQRLRLLRLRDPTEVAAAPSESPSVPRERFLSSLLRYRESRRDSESTDSGESSRSIGPARLRMFEVPQGAILMEDVRPETSLRMSLVQAQYLQEVLLRISSLLDNLHILSQMNERLEDDPRLRTILAFATLDPDNMSYEQLLMLDELLPKNQGATKEMIVNNTSLQQFHKIDCHENESCIICITDFQENDGIRLLPCCHIYHFHCIDNWLKRKKTCPMCRAQIDEKPSKCYLERLEKYSKDFRK